MTTPIPNPLDSPAVRRLIAAAYAAGRWDERIRNELGHTPRLNVVNVDRFADTAVALGLKLHDLAGEYDQCAGIPSDLAATVRDEHERAA